MNWTYFLISFASYCVGCLVSDILNRNAAKKKCEKCPHKQLSQDADSEPDGIDE